jgi:predicted dehydrogenase
MVLALQDRFDLAAVCEAQHARLADALSAAGPSTRGETNLNSLIRGAGFDFAIVATRQDASARILPALLEAGFSALVEVPPAYELPAIRRMIELAGQRGLVLASAENYVRTPIERLKQQLVARGAFGRIERAEIHGSIGHKGHEMSLARSYLGVDAVPVRARAEGEGPLRRTSGEGIPIPKKLSGEVEFDTGGIARFELSLPVRAHGSAELRSDFSGTRGGFRSGSFYVREEDGSERKIAPEFHAEDRDGEAVLQEVVFPHTTPVSWKNPYAGHSFPRASVREYHSLLDPSPQAWEIAVADMYDDTAAAVRDGLAPEYPVARSLVDVRIRLALLESTRRAGSWVAWDETRFGIERELVRARPVRWLGMRPALYRPLSAVARAILPGMRKDS